jgi:hypothetical protein
VECFLSPKLNHCMMFIPYWDYVCTLCALPRRLLWRGLGFCTSKSTNVFLPTKGSMLFEHTMYL